MKEVGDSVDVDDTQKASRRRSGKRDETDRAHQQVDDAEGLHEPRRGHVSEKSHRYESHSGDDVHNVVGDVGHNHRVRTENGFGRNPAMPTTKKARPQAQDSFTPTLVPGVSGPFSRMFSIVHIGQCENVVPTDLCFGRNL